MRILTFLGIFPLMALSLCGGWDARLAASYLDARQQEWLRWPPAKATGGTCLSCHTGATYLLARPALRRVLGESRPTSYETGLLEGLRARAGLLEAKEVSPAFAAEPPASQRLGVQAVFAAPFLSLADTGGATLDADAQKGFDRLWSLQLWQGSARGAWPWFNLDLDPYEMPNSLFYGAAVAALAAGNAPAEYRKQPKVQQRIAELNAYFARERESLVYLYHLDLSRGPACRGSPRPSRIIRHARPMPSSGAPACRFGKMNRTARSSLSARPSSVLITACRLTLSRAVRSSSSRIIP